MPEDTNPQPAKSRKQSSPSAQNPATVSILCRPELDKSVGGFPHTGVLRFPSPVRPETEGRVSMSMAATALSPGHQIVTWEEYSQMQQNPFWESFIKKGVITVILPRPDLEKSTRTTADYNLEDAFDIIAQSQDVDWLRLCMNKDDRDGIVELCQQQIGEIEESLSNREVA